MTNLSRRNFFRLTAGAAAAVAVAKVGGARAAETIWCDGLHDDGPGLTALLRGEAVEFRLPELAQHIGWLDENHLELNGNFTLHSPVELGETFRGKTIIGGRYINHAEYAFRIKPASRSLAKDGRLMRFIGMDIRTIPQLPGRFS